MYQLGFHVDDQETGAKRIQEIYPQGAPKSGLTAPVTLKPEGPTRTADLRHLDLGMERKAAAERQTRSRTTVIMELNLR
jgi:hypothetical protein